MSAPDLWRVQSSPDGHNIVDSTGAFIAQCVTEDVATYVVGLRNAAQVPQAWQWQSPSRRWYTLNPGDPREDEDYKGNPNRYRPLFALPESQP